MNGSRVSSSAWRTTLFILIATIAIPISVAILITTQGTPAADQIVWHGFDHHWSINSGSISSDQWQVQAISNSMALAVHPIDRSAFAFEARVTTGDPSLATGLIINAQNKDNFTAFLISGDGYISLREMRNGQWLDRAAWQEWPHVRRDGQSNVLRVECDPNRCTFWVNDEVTVLHSLLTPGQAIGLIAYPLDYAEPPARVAFDRVVALQPATFTAADSAP